MQRQRQLLRLLGYATAVAICITLLIFVIGVTWIGFDVKSQCQQARREYGGDCTEALIRLVDVYKRQGLPPGWDVWKIRDCASMKSCTEDPVLTPSMILLI